MKRWIAGRKALILVGLALGLVVGSAAIASAFPAGTEAFPTGDTSCMAAEGLAPQLRKESELRAACAPSAPVAEVGEVRQPVPSTPSTSPVVAVLPWLAVGLAFVIAVAVTGIRARKGGHGRPGPKTAVATIALAAVVLLTASCGEADPVAGQGGAASAEASEPIGEEQLSRVDLEDGSWPFLDLIGSGLLACEDDGSITFTPPAGGDTYAVNRLAQDAGYANIEGISIEGRPMGPILERGLGLCPADLPSGAAEPAS